MQSKQTTDNERSIKQLRLQLQSLTRELSKTTEQLQLLEIHSELGEHIEDGLPKEEISELIKKQNKISHEIIAIKKKIQRMSAKTILKAELVVLPILAVLLFYGVTTHFGSDGSEIQGHFKTRYLIENLQGESGPAYKYWNIAKGMPLTVSIVNPDNLSQEKINMIKEAILSTEPVYVDNSLLGKSPPDAKSEYFKGWKGALANINDTKYYVPNQFDIVESTNGPGQIVITLSHLEDPDGYSGYTRSVVDDSQILKSFITIYDANKLSDSQLATIVRHEFGHALGLPHSNDSQDLMHAVIQTEYPFISKCDISAIKSLYDGNAINENCGAQ